MSEKTSVTDHLNDLLNDLGNDTNTTGTDSDVEVGLRPTLETVETTVGLRTLTHSSDSDIEKKIKE